MAGKFELFDDPQASSGGGSKRATVRSSPSRRPISPRNRRRRASPRCRPMLLARPSSTSQARRNCRRAVNGADTHLGPSMLRQLARRESKGPACSRWSSGTPKAYRWLRRYSKWVTAAVSGQTETDLFPSGRCFNPEVRELSPDQHHRPVPVYSSPQR